MTDEKLQVIMNWTQRCEILPQAYSPQHGLKYGFVGWFSVMDISHYTSMVETDIYTEREGVINEMWSTIRESIIILVAQVELREK